MSNAFEIKQPAMDRLLRAADTQQGAIDHEIRVAFGWVHAGAFLEAVSPQLLASLQALLIATYRDGYIDGSCDRSTTAQATHTEWLNALLDGSLVVNHKDVP